MKKLEAEQGDSAGGRWEVKGVGCNGSCADLLRQDVPGWWAARTLTLWCLFWGGVIDSRTPSDTKFHRSSSLLCKMAYAQSLSPDYCYLMDCSLPDSSVQGILQARIMEWVAMPSSRGSSWPKDQTLISCIGRWVLRHWVTWEACKMAQYLLNSWTSSHRL